MLDLLLRGGPFRLNRLSLLVGLLPVLRHGKVDHSDALADQVTARLHLEEALVRLLLLLLAAGLGIGDLVRDVGNLLDLAGQLLHLVGVESHEGDLVRLLQLVDDHVLVLKQVTGPLGEDALRGLQLCLGTQPALIDHSIHLSLLVLELLPNVLEDLGDDEALVAVLVVDITLARGDLLQHALELVSAGHAILQQMLHLFKNLRMGLPDVLDVTVLVRAVDDALGADRRAKASLAEVGYLLVGVLRAGVADIGPHWHLVSGRGYVGAVSVR